MTVGQLISVLMRVDRSLEVWVTFAKEDERPAKCIMIDRHYGVHICDSAEEVSVSDRVLFDERDEYDHKRF